MHSDHTCPCAVQRYADYRRLARIAGQVGMRKRDDTTAEAAPVEPRQVGR